MKQHVGLYITTNGKHDPRNGKFADFVKKVEAAAAAKPAKIKRTNTHRLKNAGNPAGLWDKPIPDDKRCEFVWSKGPKKGERCRRWAMKGGTRCVSHGGYREQPDHPATIRRLGMIQAQGARALANKQLRQAPHKLRHTVEEALRAEGLPLAPETILQGIEAIEQDDAGRAWRRFIKAARLSAPTGELRARKKKLASRPERTSRDTSKHWSQR